MSLASNIDAGGSITDSNRAAGAKLTPPGRLPWATPAENGAALDDAAASPEPPASSEAAALGGFAGGCGVRRADLRTRSTRREGP